MKEYKCIQMELQGKLTEKLLNDLAKEEWRVICSYASHNMWLILEREKK